MHIGFLTPEYPHAQATASAGIGTTIKNLAQALLKQKIKVSIFVYGQSKAEILEEGLLTIHLIPLQQKGFFTWYSYRKYLQNYLNKCIVSEQIDLIEAPDWTGITAFMKLSAPLVIRLHGTDAYFCKLEGRKQKVKNFWFEKLGLKTADAIISPTQYTAKLTCEIFKLNPQLLQVIPSGISLEHFQNPNPNQYQKGLILYLGTIIRKKGVLELSHIFERVLKQCDEAELILIGGDSYDIKTKSDSTWLLLQNALDGRSFSRMKHLGRVPYEQVQDYIRQANVCVFPTFAETQGMVTIESMAMQKAVVNSNIGWAQEILSDSSEGFLVHPKNHDEFANRIIQLIQNPELVSQLGKAAQERVHTAFDIQKTVHTNIDFYTSVIQQYSKR
ncbi:glycosyltransferase family 4 protein [Flavobacterium sp. CYK-55]|uniref:glycosyltransferase family 4 protein n=1 Tax=Flavobacterium sp. CYK-55 TaxID=2835529 RepID=UPI001BD0EAD4|nr:glycosyltransferase family 4 protein [Flavobacterium sp. CYK-55]MBS7786400.1 glycosyltransferase family 4 protein [Flavobacterium sp. CYK-55]